MTTKLDKERFKTQQDKAQAILSQLLKDEDNKYCVDCDAKGPRWSSWNLGIFLCIRCAGIHRNMGVHISKVKSVNLDTWLPEQISMVMEMGNSRARAVYEAEIPDGFRRPQTDSALESFIRAKYEHKKYIAREWIPPSPRIPAEFLEDDSDKKKRNRPKPTSSVQLNVSSSSRPKPQAGNSTVNTNGEVKGSIPAPSVDSTTPAASQESNNSIDLLGLDVPEIQSQSAGSNLLDDLLGSTNISNTAPSLAEPEVNQSPTTNGDIPLMDDTSQTKTKESILALYGTGGPPAQYGVPGGMYMAQNAQNMGMYGGGGGNMNMMAPGMMAPGMQQGMQQGMPSQMPNMGMQPMMYNMVAPGMSGQPMMAPMGMYGNSPQVQPHMQYQQLPQQMAGMKLGAGVPGQMPMMQGMGGGMMMGQPVGGNMVMGAPGTGQWNNTQSTLATNLWQ